MSATAHRVTYFRATVANRLGEAYHLLSHLASEGVNLLAFNAVPIGPDQSHLVLFAEDVTALVRACDRMGVALTGPEHALLVEGDDALGVLAGIHRQLYDARVNVYASSGVTSGKGGYGYIIHVKSEDFEAAARALGV